MKRQLTDSLVAKVSFSGSHPATTTAAATATVASVGIGGSSGDFNSRNSNVKQPPSNSNSNSNSVKTQLCNVFTKGGDCKFGDRCRYFHPSHIADANVGGKVHISTANKGLGGGSSNYSNSRINNSNNFNRGGRNMEREKVSIYQGEVASLPIASYKHQLIDSVKTFATTIVLGETGCGNFKIMLLE
jgi:HrpA-like RNA helicase